MEPALSTVAIPDEAKALRRVFGSFATGVTIITTRDAKGSLLGLTANSFNVVSLDPPLVLWSLRRLAASVEVFRRAEHWAVHILAADQRTLADRFASREIDRFAGLHATAGIGGVPLLDGCAAVLQCRASAQHEAGDHLILVGEVLRHEARAIEPLVFHASGYARLQR